MKLALSEYFRSLGLDCLEKPSNTWVYRKRLLEWWVVITFWCNNFEFFFQKIYL